MVARIIPPDQLPPAPTLMITSESQTHVVLSIEIAKATLVDCRRLLEQLLDAATDGRPR